MVIQEAMASGLPMVVADDPGYERHLEGAPGTIVRVPGDPQALLESLCGLEFGTGPSDDDRDALAAFAAERFSWARCAEAHEALYRSLLERATVGSGAQRSRRNRSG